MEVIDKTKYYIDLSKLSEGERKKAIALLPEPELDLDYKIDSNHCFLYFDIYKWYIGRLDATEGKTELTYPEFIKLFEGGEGKNNGWIKIESEADLPKEAGDYWVIRGNKIIVQYWFTINDYDLIKQTNDWMQVVTHYQPITKPLPPKF